MADDRLRAAWRHHFSLGSETGTGAKRGRSWERNGDAASIDGIADVAVSSLACQEPHDTHPVAMSTTS